jgi:pentatricopeptide repeat protein
MPSGTRLSSIFAAGNTTAATTSTASSPRAPHAALAAATEHVSFGTLRPDDAHHLFDEMQRQPALVPVRTLNGFLAALARALPSAACRDGPALAVALFGKSSSCMPPSIHTYGIILDCCCCMRRLDLVLALFSHSSGLGINFINFSYLLKGLCNTKRTDEAMDVLLHKMPKLSCVPNVVSYLILLKGFCDDRRCQRALDLLWMMAEKGGGFSPDIVAYTTVIHGFFKEDEIAKACDLFHEMVQQGIRPDVATYNCIIDALCKVRAMDKAEEILREMVEKGVLPDTITYTSLIHGYCTIHGMC